MDVSIVLPPVTCPTPFQKQHAVYLSISAPVNGISPWPVFNRCSLTTLHYCRLACGSISTPGGFTTEEIVTCYLHLPMYWGQERSAEGETARITKLPRVHLFTELSIHVLWKASGKVFSLKQYHILSVFPFLLCIACLWCLQFFLFCVKLGKLLLKKIFWQQFLLHTSCLLPIKISV